jgi:hypothetical protein
MLTFALIGPSGSVSNIVRDEPNGNWGRHQNQRAAVVVVVVSMLVTRAKHIRRTLLSTHDLDLCQDSNNALLSASYKLASMVYTSITLRNSVPALLQDTRLVHAYSLLKTLP